MSTLLNAIGPQPSELRSLSYLAKEILAKLKAYPFKRSLKHDHKTEEEGYWHYEITYYEREDYNPNTPFVDILFGGPYCHFPHLRPKTIEIGTFYNYS